MIIPAITYTLFWLPCAFFISYFLLGKKTKLFYCVVVFIYLAPLWETIPTHYKMSQLCAQPDRFMIYKKYYFKDAVLEEKYKKRLDENGQVMDKEVPIKGDTGLYYVVVFDKKLNKPNVYFRPETSIEENSFLITKVKYILYDNKGDIFSHYINYMASKTGEGDLEVFYNPFLLVKVLKRSRCDTYEEAPKKYQQMINQAIIIQPATLK